MRASRAASRSAATVFALAAVLAGCGTARPPRTSALADAPAPVVGLVGPPHVAWVWPLRDLDQDVARILPLDDGLVVGVGRTLARLDEDGRRRWATRLDEAADWQVVAPRAGLVVGVALDQSSRHGTTAVSLAGGRVRWHRRDTALAAYGRGVLLRLADANGELGEAGAGGRLLWRRPAQAYAVDGDALYLGTRGRLTRYRGDAADRRRSTAVAGGDVESVAADVRTVLVTTEREVTALDPSSGRVRWTRPARLGATAGLLTPSLTWVLPVHRDDEDGPPRSVDVVDDAGRPAGRIAVPGPSFAGQAFRVGGTSYVLDGDRLQTSAGRRLPLPPADLRVPSTTGVYAITDRQLSLVPYGRSRPVWSLALPRGGLSATPVDGAVYVVLPRGVVAYGS